EAMPEAHTSVPASGAVGRPVNTMSRNTVPDMNTSIAGESASRRSASGSHHTGSCGVSTIALVTLHHLSVGSSAGIVPPSCATGNCLCANLRRCDRSCSSLLGRLLLPGLRYARASGEPSRGDPAPGALLRRRLGGGAGREPRREPL